MDDNAVSAVVGFILIVLIAITFIGIVQSVMLPEWNKGEEIDHSIELSYDMAKMGETIALSSTTGKSTLLSLNPALSYPKRPFLISPTFASATISAEKQYLSIKSDKINYEGNTYAIIVLPNYHYSAKPKFLYEHSATFKSYNGNPTVNSKQSSFKASSISIYILNSTFSSLAVNGPINLIFEPVSYGGKTLVNSAWINFTVSNETAEWWNESLAAIYGENNVSRNGNWINISVSDVYLSLNYLIVQASTSQSKAEITAARQAVEIVNLSSPPSEVYKGVTVPLGVRVLDKFYNPVPNWDVDVLLNSNLVETKKSDERGEVWYYFEANATGDYDIEFRITGDSYDSYTYSLSVISSSTTTGIFDISWNATPSGDIFVDDWNVSLEGSQKQYKVTVTYEGNPVSDAKIDLSTDSPNLVSIPAESITDTNGESTVAITALDNGTANVIAASGGSSGVLRLFITGAGGSVCPAGWGYWREITIDNPGTDLVDYQIKVELDNSNFDFSKANSDGSDIRFYDSDSTTQLNYWIEEWGSSHAIIWVKVPSIPSGTKKIYMFYGNPSATSLSDGSSTFDFFDDFNSDTSSNYTIRERWSGSPTFIWEPTNSRIRTDTSNADFFLTTSSSLSSDFIVEVKAYTNDNDAVGALIEAAGNDFYIASMRVSDYDGSTSGRSTETLILYGNVPNGHFQAIRLTDYGEIVNPTSWQVCGIAYDGNNLFSYYNHQKQTTGYSVGNLNIRSIGLSTQANSPPAYYDWLLVRKYASQEPSLALGAEQQC
ncbi:MAG: DUF2341 domain-containing protein [Archaeoglobus sp.]|nr:DUF2341 domain-containing protein [Archaeoglobus sp.]